MKRSVLVTFRNIDCDIFACVGKTRSAARKMAAQENGKVTVKAEETVAMVQ